MNKEQVLHHKPVMQWFIENPDLGVWRKDRTNDKSTWRLSRAPEFSVFSSYVQNDTYSKFRMAQADGKTIQYHCKEFNTLWEDITWNTAFEAPLDHYRIKPKESTFTVGDWVRCIPDDIVFQVDGHINGGYQDTKYWCKQDFEPWKPKVGEWVIPLHTLYKDFFYVEQWGKNCTYECQPFIGNLPQNFQH